MLEEKKISASSTWERELSKIVFDSRYLLLTAAERRAAFEAHQRELREREKIERRKARKSDTNLARYLLFF
jgi:transcription elongation regulator 1